MAMIVKFNICYKCGKLYKAKNEVKYCSECIMNLLSNKRNIICA